MDISPYKEELHNLKVVAFLEVDPNSDHFHQIMFTGKQIKAVRDYISRKILKVAEDDSFIVTTNDKHCYTFDNIKDEYTDQEIDDIHIDGEDGEDL
jgi:hypothetical protein